MEEQEKQTWQQRCRGINARFMKLAQKKGNLTSNLEILRFLALAICGEAGELANLIKKSWRGDAVEFSMVQDEIADIRIYLEHIAQHLGINLDEVCERKLEEVNKRLTLKETE